MQRALNRHQPSPSDDGASNYSRHHQQQLGPLESILSCLWVVTPLAATVSLAVVAVAMLTNHWLHTEERMNNPAYNGTGDKDYLSKMTVSGLWTLCYTNPGETIYHCIRIDYFTKEEYRPDPNDSTMAIPYAVTKSIIFFGGATCLLFAAYCFCILGQCTKHRGLYTFVSGVAFVITGLIMLFGLIMYISVFKSEVGSKLRPRSQLQLAPITYSYGFSFLLYVCGFVSTQLAGVSSIFLFIYKMQYEYRAKYLDNLRRGKNCMSSSSINYVPLEQHIRPCRRHPQAYINSSSIHIPVTMSLPTTQKRYYFSKESLHESSPCSVHRTTSAVKDVATFYDFPPPPPTISYQFDEEYHHHQQHFPRDLTTNTVSTTADVLDDYLIGDRFDEYSPSGGVHQDHEFVTFDLDQPLPLRAQSTVSISSRNGRPSKDLCNDTMRRTTPV